MVEYEQVAVKVGRRSTSYTASPFESAFTEILSYRFNTFLGPASLSRDNRLVRLAPPVLVNNGVLAFQYSRFDILQRSKSQLVSAYKEQNPDFVPTASNPEDLYDQVEAEMADEERVTSELLRNTEIRGERIDKLQALTDPEYYGLKIIRWPELFEFSLFERMEEVTRQSNYRQFGRRGMLNGRRPDIYGALALPASLGSDRDYSEGLLTIRFPRVFYTTARAYAIVYAGEIIKSSQISRIVDQIDWFPTSKPIEHPVFPRHYSPQVIMGEFGAFVEELTKVK